MKRIKHNAAWTLLAALLLGPGALWGATAKLEGVVVDIDEKPIAGAVVTVTATDGSAQQSATTNRKGKFDLAFREMAPGFTMKVEAEGFATYEGPIDLTEGKTLDLTIPLLSAEAAAQQRAQIAAIEARNKAARRYNEGAEKYNEGKIDEAIALFREAVDEEEGLAIGWAGLGRIYLEQERFADAADAFQRFDAIEPDREPVLLMLYDSYIGMNDGDKASALLERLVKDFSGEGTAARVFNQGVAAIKAKNLQLAREQFKSALEIYPDLYQAHLNLAHIARAFEDWETTLAEVDMFLASEPQQARALALRYQALKALERPEAAEALAVLRQAAPEDTAQTFHEEGVKLFNAGQTEDALAAFLSAIEIFPEHARAHYRAGLCFASLKNNVSAREYLERFIALAPNDGEAATAKEMLAYL